MTGDEPIDFAAPSSGSPDGEPWESGPPPDRFDDGEPSSPAATLRPETPAEIVARWQREGPIVRVPTGITTLDEACRGGLPIPWRVFIVGAPSAGKTAATMTLARRFVDAGLVVGVLGIDEEPDDLNVRLAQMAGFTIADCEARDPATLDSIAAALADLPVRFYGAEYTIEAAATDLAAAAASSGKRAAFVVDSVQIAQCAAVAMAERPKSAREAVDANVAALRTVATQHRMLVLATSEANRGSYRSEDAAEASNDMAAGKESSSIEFSAQTLLMLRTPRGYSNHVHVRVPKNRRGARAGFEFFLKLDRERHSLTECADPTEGDSAHEMQERDEKRRRTARADVERDARVLLDVVRETPGMGERALRARVRLQGHKWGNERLDAAKERLVAGLDGEVLVNRGKGQTMAWHVERV